MIESPIGLAEFLKEYPGMAILPCNDSGLSLRGSFSFSAQAMDGRIINDVYDLKIMVPSRFPKCIPTVIELSSKIPRSKDFHVNPDGTLCLGSPIRLLSVISKFPTLCGFAKSCLIPFLYAISLKLESGENFVFGELPHGEEGTLEDYVDLFGLENAVQAKNALKLLGMNSEKANKQICPCGCGNRLSKCKFHEVLGEFREFAPSFWYRDQYHKKGKSQ